MTTGTILLITALLLLTAVFVVRPFLLPSPKERDRAATGKRRALEAEKQAVMEQIISLDFDHSTGKLPDEKYQHQRENLMQTAADILRQLDETQPTAEAEMEAAIAALRQKAAAPQAAPAPRPAAPPPATMPAIEKNGTEQTTPVRNRFCSQCGKPTDPADKFCAFCGYKLVTVGEAA